MLRAMLVKEEDVVVVGQVVAVLDVADATSVTNSTTPSTPAPSPVAPKQSLEELTDAASRISDSALRGAKARIQFPPRRTDTGMVISFMPVCDQKTYTAREMAAKTAQVLSQSNPAGSSSLKTREDTTYLRAPASRSVMAELEMESIMLGGAPP
jgi:pyruvate/2-oxoglutarate dehydrogenase complex dihydrolipoamide acyltransferase (E2) component